MGNLHKKVAIVYDWAVKWGGAEQILLALHELFPEAPLFTSVYDENNAKWASVFPKVVPSFLQKIPFAKSHHELFLLFTPLAFESLDLSSYDLVISVSSSDSKAVITGPQTLHICYCLTPTRYLWSHNNDYLNQHKYIPQKLKSYFTKILRKWDLYSSNRPDKYIAISKTVQDRIDKFYGKKSEVIYPPFENKNTEEIVLPSGRKENFLWVGRFVSYKQPLEVVRVFNKLNLPLNMVGTGSLLSKAKSLASKNINFYNFVSEGELRVHYKNSKALIMFHEEDFGLVSLESQSHGTPVLGINSGGLLETVIDGKTGSLGPSLEKLLLNFDSTKYSQEHMKEHVLKFSKERFLKEFAKVTSRLWIEHQRTLTS